MTGRSAHRVAQVRRAERAVLDRVPEGALMQRAAAGLAACCAGELRSRRGRVTGARVVLLVGSGNNGGDALWAGARLSTRGARVDAVLLSPGPHAEGLAALLAAGGRAVPVSTGSDATGSDRVVAARRLLAAADLVVDGIVGLGGAPGLREPAAGLVGGLVPSSEGGPVLVAVDLPSGVDADGGGLPAAHVRADVTVSFGTLKPCLLLPPACRAAGRVELVDLGLVPELPSVAAVDRLTDADVARLWPVPGPDDDKYSRGVVGVVAGSAGYPGAAVLAVGGALRAGAGMVRYVGPERPTGRVLARWPEAVTGAGRVQAWTLGSGVDPDADDGQPDAVVTALGQRLPTVVDAGALGIIVGERVRGLLGPRTVLTPHAGELARLLTAWPGAAAGRGPATPDRATPDRATPDRATPDRATPDRVTPDRATPDRVTPDRVTRDDVRAEPLRHAVLAAELTGATVLLKGAITVIADPAGRCRTQAEGPGWLATAGAGDVLAGIIGTLLAAGLAPLDAAGLGALVHGRAAARASAGGPIVAEDVITALPGTLAGLLGPG